MGWSDAGNPARHKADRRTKKQLAKAIKRAKRDGKIAASAQQTIPYDEMYENGVCSLGNRLYSKSVAFEDRSYTEVSDDDKAVILSCTAG